MGQMLFLNPGPGSATIPLPSGGSYTLPQGHIVVGNYFHKLSFAGTLRIVTYTPVDPTKLHNPLKIPAEDIGVTAPKASKSEPKEVAVPVVPPAQEPSKAEATSPVEPVVDPNSFDGKSRDTWMLWLVEHEADLLQEKLAKLTKLAAFLGVATPGNTKADVIRSIMAKVMEEFQE